MEAKDKIAQILKEAKERANELAYLSEGKFQEGEMDSIYQDAYLAIYQAGIREVVEYINSNYWVDDYGNGNFNIGKKWQEKLKEWEK